MPMEVFHDNKIQDGSTLVSSVEQYSNGTEGGAASNTRMLQYERINRRIDNYHLSKIKVSASAGITLA
jgi:hypothetical protein